jgi:hypothetical protein
VAPAALIWIEPAGMEDVGLPEGTEAEAAAGAQALRAIENISTTVIIFQNF